MKIYRTLIAILLCIMIAILPGCRNSGVFSLSTEELKIGVEGLTGNYNPFYAESDADIEIISQMFRPIQRRGSDNTLINHSGSISYEFAGDTQVKYTVSINDDMYFSNGTHITIDDVIFMYHFIADATYDGIYSDWYLNDIAGLKEYYFDDKNYQEEIVAIDDKVNKNYTLSTITADDYISYLVATNLENSYSGFDEKSPSGTTWREYLISQGYLYDIEQLGDNPEEKELLRLTARAEVEKRPLAYNPETWYREKLYTDYMNENYADGINVDKISGINKINDYTCSILFNSRNINAISEINVPIIPMTEYSTDYVKGNCDTVKNKFYFNAGSGPYLITENTETEVKMKANTFYTDADCEFDSLRFIDLKAKGDDPIKSVKSGVVDVVKTLATSEAVSALKDAPVQYYINNCDYYLTLYFNAKTLSLYARKAFISLCDTMDTAENEIGSYYSRIYRPLSLRFNEYPESVDKPYYPKDKFGNYKSFDETAVKEVSAYYCGTEQDFEYLILSSVKEIFENNQIRFELIVCDEATLNEAIKSGNADIWLERVYDGATCDKFDYYNSIGALNKTGINTAEIDELTSSIRSAVGFSNKAKMTEKLMELVMVEAVECPMYQLQTITVYNTETVNPDSFKDGNNFDGFTYYIPFLKKL